MHELNQPLTSILSNSQAARRFLDAENPDLAEVREAIDDVISEDKRAAGIINGLRNLLRNQDVEIGEFEIGETIRRVAGMVSGDIHTTGTNLELSLAPHPIKVEASEVQIEQVLFNLIQNALRALAQVTRFERKLRISSTVRDESVIVSIADSGPGIPDDLAPQIFEPFKSGSESLGMGLAICKRIATAHGGRIWHEASELGGAKFVFSLPSNGKKHLNG